jgi:hypothetical protein
MRARIRLAAIAFTAVSAAGILAGILPAAAAAAPAVDCTQNPATNSAKAADLFGSGVNIRTGPFTSCTSVGEGQFGQSVTAHCSVTNSNGVNWVYLTDHTTGKTGWSEAQFVGVVVGNVSSCG